VTVTTITATSVGGVNISGTDLTDKDSAADALDTLKDSLRGISNSRADIGAGMNRLQSAVAVLQTQAQNTLAAESNIRDANMAEEIANMTKFQILAQSGIAALSQANATAQTVLALLRQ
jgi:flagellin